MGGYLALGCKVMRQGIGGRMCLDRAHLEGPSSPHFSPDCATLPLIAIKYITRTSVNLHFRSQW